jgi:hypothetical protein
MCYSSKTGTLRHPFIPPLFRVSTFVAGSSFLTAAAEILPAVFPPLILFGAAFNRSAYLPLIDR